MGRLKLFDGDGDDEHLSRIEINQEFARRYEHNKKREDLQRYEELKRKGQADDSGSDSEDSGSSEEEISLKQSKKADRKYFDALIKIRNKDPVLKNKDATLFSIDSDSDSELEIEGGSYDADGKNDSKKGKKPMYLKDVVSKQLIAIGPELDDSDEEIGKEDGKVKSYSEEQEEFRRNVLKEMMEEENNVGGEGDLLKVKEGDAKEEDVGLEDEVGTKLDEYFGKDEKLDENTMFLKEYFRNRMWLDNEKNADTLGGEVDYSEDEEEIERQEDYERGFNFRFEENAGDRVMSHSRKVEGSVRKKDNSRKLQRDRKEERMAQAEIERAEELKHLKNLKKKEMSEKLEKIRKVAGLETGGVSLLDEDYLEEEFDPDEYDRKMDEAFDDKYYNAEDEDPQFGDERDDDLDLFQKPDFDKEDELLGLSKGWDDLQESGEGFESSRKRIMSNMDNLKEKHELVGDDGSKQKRKRKSSEMEKEVREQLMEEYYKLDYEDTVGDLKTRFKYKQVKARRYGLSAAQILDTDEKDLNQYVSLKKLAPYREDWKVPRIKTVQFKQMNMKILNGESSVSVNKDRRKKMLLDDQKTTEVLDAVENEGSRLKELNNDTNYVSRRSKRRTRQAELKPSHSRLMAFSGATKSKKKKH